MGSRRENPSRRDRSQQLQGTINDRWFWKLTSIWEAPPPDPYSRHAVEDTDQLLDQFEACRPWAGRRRLVLESSRKARLEDFPFIMIPLMSRRAVDALRDLLEEDGKFVPVELRRKGERLNAEYYAFNCLRLYSAFDGSSINRNSPEERYRREVTRLPPPLRLTYERVPKRTNAFRCRHYTNRLLVSERVAERLMQSELSGWMLSDPQDPPWRCQSIVSPHRV